MGIVSFQTEIPCSVPPAKMFKAYAIHGNSLIPKILPQVVKKITILQGHGGPGTIKEFSFGEGSKMKSCVKHRVDAVDEAKFTYSFSLIEGEDLANKLEKISNDIKFEANPNGGSIFKGTSKFYTLENVEIKEDEIMSLREKTLATFKTIFKAIEAHVLAHPDDY